MATMRSPVDRHDAVHLLVRHINDLTVPSGYIHDLIDNAAVDKERRERIYTVTKWVQNGVIAMGVYSATQAVVARAGMTLAADDVDVWPSEEFVARLYMAIELDPKAKSKVKLADYQWGHRSTNGKWAL